MADICVRVRGYTASSLGNPVFLFSTINLINNAVLCSEPQIDGLVVGFRCKRLELPCEKETANCPTDEDFAALLQLYEESEK